MTGDSGTLALVPIGVVHAAFTDRYAAPRQPEAAAETTEAVIELFPGRNFEQALADLAGFDRIWVLYWFHRNTTWKPRVLPPRGRIRRGVFATRSPHRPNPLGLSAVELLGVQGRRLHIGRHDMLDGTPVLDIKPYIPYADAFPGARAGWLDDLPDTVFAVHWSDTAVEQHTWLRTQFGVDLRSVVDPLLRIDPYPHPYRRITPGAEGSLVMACQSWRLVFTVADTTVRILRIDSGYTYEQVLAAPPETLHMQAAHEAFHRRHTPQ